MHFRGGIFKVESIEIGHSVREGEIGTDERLRENEYVGRFQGEGKIHHDSWVSRLEDGVNGDGLKSEFD